MTTNSKMINDWKFFKTLLITREIVAINVWQNHSIISNQHTILEINYGLKQAGANDYLLKPVTPKSLIAVIEKISLPVLAT